MGGCPFQNRRAVVRFGDRCVAGLAQRREYIRQRHGGGEHGRGERAQTEGAQPPVGGDLPEQGGVVAAQAARDRGAKDEPTAFRADDQIDILPAIWIRQQLDRQPQPRWCGQQRSDIPKEDAGFGEIRDFAD